MEPEVQVCFRVVPLVGARRKPTSVRGVGSESRDSRKAEFQNPGGFPLHFTLNVDPSVTRKALTGKGNWGKEADEETLRFRCPWGTPIKAFLGTQGHQSFGAP